jgi:hypothetical protein
MSRLWNLNISFPLHPYPILLFRGELQDEEQNWVNYPENYPELYEKS